MQTFQTIKIKTHITMIKCLKEYKFKIYINICKCYDKMDVIKPAENVYQVSIKTSNYSIAVTLNTRDPWTIINSDTQKMFEIKEYGHVIVTVEEESPSNYLGDFFNEIPVKHFPYTHTCYNIPVVNKIVDALNKICSLIDKERSSINSTGNYSRFVDYNKPQHSKQDTHSYIQEAEHIKRTNPITFKIFLN